MNKSNPYASPQSSHVDVPLEAAAIRKIRPPTTGLMVMLVIQSVGYVFAGVIALGEWVLGEPVGATIIGACLAVLHFFAMAFMIRAMCRIRRLQDLRNGRFAAVLACVPFITPAIWIGIPLGVWLSIILSNDDVAEAFSKHAAIVPARRSPKLGGSVKTTNADIDTYSRHTIMATVERFKKHPSIADHSLYLVECDTFSEIVPAVSSLPFRFFVALLVADFRTIVRDDLVELSSQMIDAGSRCFSAWGEQCRIAHLAFDLACSEFEPNGDGVVPTMDHGTESIEYAIWRTLNCAQPVKPYDRDWNATVAVCVDDQSAGQVVRAAFASPVAFSELYGPDVEEET